MSTEKVFSVAGTSVLNGERKLRFANDIMRIKVLAKHGHTDITLVELPKEMPKDAAAHHLSTLDEFQGPEDQAAIADYTSRKVDKPVKKEKAAAKVTPQVPALEDVTPLAVTAKPKVKAEKIDLSKYEDAPF